MHVIAFNPFVAAGRAAQMGVRLVSLDELLRLSGPYRALVDGELARLQRAA